MTRRRRHFVIALAALLLGGGAAGGWWYSTLWPKRFAAVVPGELYRSGEITPAQLERLHRDPGIRRVISLLDPGVSESQVEKTAAERLGIRWENVPLRGNGESTAEERDRLRALLLESGAGPTLVHCAAGVNRTGLAVGMYRLHRQHWSLDAVMAELLRSDFENLPKHEDLRAALRAEAELAGPEK